MPTSKHVWAGAGAATAVLVTLVLAFLVLGSPSKQRMARADWRRTRDLVQIAGKVNRKWAKGNHTLPPRLDAISENVPRDPITGAPYGYQPTGANRYQLCATFASDSRKEAGHGAYKFWAHPKGHHCFKLDASQSVPQFNLYGYP